MPPEPLSPTCRETPGNPVPAAGFHGLPCPWSCLASKRRPTVAKQSGGVSFCTLAKCVAGISGLTSAGTPARNGNSFISPRLWTQFRREQSTAPARKMRRLLRAFPPQCAHHNHSYGQSRARGLRQEAPATVRRGGTNRAASSPTQPRRSSQRQHIRQPENLELATRWLPVRIGKLPSLLTDERLPHHRASLTI